MKRRPYPSDVSDEEGALVAPYLSLLPQTAAQRRHELRDVFNAVRYIVRTGVPWRWYHNFPPWEAVYQQTALSRQAGLKRLSRTCGSWSVRRRDASPSPARRLWIAGLCVRRRRVGNEQAWTGTRAGVARRSMQWSIPWARSWR